MSSETKSSKKNQISSIVRKLTAGIGLILFTGVVVYTLLFALMLII